MRRLTAEDGFTAGGEMLAFGVLIFVVGTLVVLGAWRVVDTKFAVSAAAREAVRAFVESAGPVGAARSDAHAAATAAIAAHNLPVGSLRGITVSGAFERCARVTATVRYRTPPLALPWVGGIGAVDVAGAHSEIVDPLRSGVPGTATCVAGGS